MTKFSPEERVRRGAAALDAEVPAWRERVDPGRLDVLSCENCVIGQVFGDYHSRTADPFFDRRVADVVTFGFDVPTECDSHVIDRLNAAWRAEVTRAVSAL